MNTDPDRARKYLATMPPAIDGSGGHAATYAAACALVNGFAMDEEHALDLLASDYNPNCLPPWSDAELRHKVKSAASKPHDKPRGHLLGDDRAKASRSAPVDPEAGGLALARYAAAKRLPIDYLAGIGLSDCAYQGKPAIRISYGDAAHRFRVRLNKGSAGEERFRNPKGVALGAYTVAEIPVGADVVLVEGESDVHTLAHNGFPAVGMPGAQTITDAMLAGYTGTMYVVDEHDGGAKHLLGKLKSMPCADRVRVLDLSPHKDPSDLWLAVDADRERFTTAMRTAILRAVPLMDYAPAKPGVGILDLLKLDPENDADALLGRRRWLCRGMLAMLYGESGLGKSSLIMKCGIAWAIGRVVFDIHCHRPMKVLLVQAENDPHDLNEMVAGALADMGITAEADRQRIHENFRIVSEPGVCGPAKVLDLIDPMMEAFKPDLLILDPLFAFLGGDASDQETASTFGRNMLMPLAKRHNVLVLMTHHTNKPQKDRPATFAGSQEWSNLCRAMVGFHAEGDDGAVLHLGKRGSRMGWTDDAGRPCFKRSLKRSVGRIAWVDAGPSDAGSKGEDVGGVDVDALVLYIASHPGKHTARSLKDHLGVGGSKLDRLISEARAAGWMEPATYVLTPPGQHHADDLLVGEEGVPDDRDSDPTGTDTGTPGHANRDRAGQAENAKRPAGTETGTPSVCPGVPLSLRRADRDTGIRIDDGVLV